MNKIEELQKRMLELRSQIKEIQEECSHPIAALDKTHKANTGNYDPSADRHWTEFHCRLCDKQWSEEGSK